MVLNNDCRNIRQIFAAEPRESPTKNELQQEKHIKSSHRKILFRKPHPSIHTNTKQCPREVHGTKIQLSLKKNTFYFECLL